MFSLIDRNYADRVLQELIRCPIVCMCLYYLLTYLLTRIRVFLIVIYVSVTSLYAAEDYNTDGGIVFELTSLIRI